MAAQVRASRAFALVAFISTAMLILPGLRSRALAGGHPPPPLQPVPAVEPGPDPYRAQQWYLEPLGMEEAWKQGKGNHQTVIAIVDSGVNYNHPDLAGNIIRDGEGTGWDFIHQNNLPYDRSGHGTFLAGLAAAL